MKAIVCNEFGPIETLTLEDRPDPVAGAGEVVIDIRAAGVNFPDGLMVRGEYQVKPPRPFTPGSEVAGVVRAVGDGVTGLRCGRSRRGTLRHRRVCRKGDCHSRPHAEAYPDAMDFEHRSRLHAGLRHIAARRGRQAARSKPARRCWCWALPAAWGLPLSRSAPPWGARHRRRLDRRETGAGPRAWRGDRHQLHHRDLKAELKRMVPAGVDVVYDPVGGALTEAAVRGLAWGGRLLVIGFAAGEIPKLPLNLLLLREGEAIGVFWGAFTQRDPARHARNIAQLCAGSRTAS